MILTLDLGATTGWALLKNDGTILSGFKKVDDKKMAAQRYPNFLKLLDEIRAQAPGRIERIIYEIVYMPQKSSRAAYAYGGYIACLEVWCDDAIIPLSGLSCVQARKAVFGNGRMSKDETFQELKKTYPRLVDHNEGDAIVMALWAKQSLELTKESKNEEKR